MGRNSWLSFLSIDNDRSIDYVAQVLSTWSKQDAVSLPLFVMVKNSCTNNLATVLVQMLDKSMNALFLILFIYCLILDVKRWNSFLHWSSLRHLFVCMFLALLLASIPILNSILLLLRLLTQFLCNLLISKLFSAALEDLFLYLYVSYLQSVCCFRLVRYKKIPGRRSMIVI